MASMLPAGEERGDRLGRFLVAVSGLPDHALGHGVGEGLHDFRMLLDAFLGGLHVPAHEGFTHENDVRIAGRG